MTAERLLLEAVDASLELGAHGNLAASLESLAGVYAGQNRLEFAIRLLAAANAYRWEHVRPLDAEEEKRVATITARVRAEAGPIRLGLAWAGGKSLTIRQAVNEVLQGARHTGVPPGAARPAGAYPSTPGSAVDPAPWS